MTTIEPLRPATAEGPLLPARIEPARSERGERARSHGVRVNLLPGEFVTARKAHRIRRIVLVVLVVLVLVLAGVSFLARAGVGDARSELAAAEAVNANLRSQQGKFTEVVKGESAVEQARTRIGTLAAGDLDWAVVTRSVLAAAPTGIAVTGVEGAGDQDSGTAGGAGGASGGTGTATGTSPGDPAATGATGASGSAAALPAGAVTVTGLAPDPATVAAYVEALTKVAGLTEVGATVVAALESGGYSFVIAAGLTADVLVPPFDTTGGR